MKDNPEREIIVYKIETIITPYLVDESYVKKNMGNASDMLGAAIKIIEQGEIPPVLNSEPRKSIGWSATHHVGFPPPDYFYAYNRR